MLLLPLQSVLFGPEEVRAPPQPLRRLRQARREMWQPAHQSPRKLLLQLLQRVLKTRQLRIHQRHLVLL